MRIRWCKRNSFRRIIWQTRCQQLCFVVQEDLSLYIKYHQVLFWSEGLDNFAQRSHFVPYRCSSSEEFIYQCTPLAVPSRGPSSSASQNMAATSRHLMVRWQGEQLPTFSLLLLCACLPNVCVGRNSRWASKLMITTYQNFWRIRIGWTDVDPCLIAWRSILWLNWGSSPWTCKRFLAWMLFFDLFFSFVFCFVWIFPLFFLNHSFPSRLQVPAIVDESAIVNFSSNISLRATESRCVWGRASIVHWGSSCHKI